jgi:uncharacterized protein
LALREDQLTHPNEDKMRAAYAAFGRGDFDALGSQYLAEDIHYHFPGRSPLARTYEGVAQVRELFGRLFELSGGTVRLEVHDVLANDEHGVGLVTVRAERAGKQYEDQTVQVIHLRDGKTTESWLYPADLNAVDEFWS